MEDDVRKAAAAAVVEKFQTLMVQRAEVVRERGEIERRIRGIDRSLFDCRAAGRLFGVDIELPEDARPGLIVRPNPARGTDVTRARPTPFLDAFAARAKLPSSNDQLPLEAPIAHGAVPTVPSTALPAGEEPSIRDLILVYLKQAGTGGIKAAVLRRKVEVFLNRQIHYKTIGMSLYRLSKESPPQVRRDGLIWTFVPADTATRNPGAATPGPIEGR